MSSLQKRLVFKKYKVGKLIYKTQISLIHEGINEITKEQVAMKFEKIGGKFDLLGTEIYYLLLLKGIGIPNVKSYGQVMNYKVLIEELLGKSIFSIWDELYRKNNLNTNKDILNDVCLIAIQCLDRLEYVHSKNIVHKDIKPANFLFGRKNPKLIYLIDFGMSKKYRSSKTGKHIKLQKLNKINGTLRYMSINSCKYYQYSRRDDLESLGYMLIFLTKNNLPWISVENEDINLKLKMEKICSLKASITPEKLCRGLPYEFCKYIDYCQKLDFEQEPDYNYLRNLFIDVLKRSENLYGLNHIKCKTFSFFDEKDSNKLKEKIFSDRRSSQAKNIEKGKINAHKRIYSHIKSSIEKNKKYLSDLSNAVCLNSDLKKISINNSKNLDDNNNKNEINYNNITITNDSQIIKKIDINILCINKNNKMKHTDRKIFESAKTKINNLIQQSSKSNQKIGNNNIFLNIGKKPNEIVKSPIQKMDYKGHIRTENNYNLMENNIPKKPISKNSTNLTYKSNINSKFKTVQYHDKRNFSQLLNFDSKQNTKFGNNQGLTIDIDFNNKSNTKYNLNEKIHYKSIVTEIERKKEKQKNQNFINNKSLLNNNFKIESKLQNRNNFYFKNNTISNNQDLTSINKSDY